MKNFKLYIGLFAFIGLLMTSCSKEDNSTNDTVGNDNSVSLKFGTLLNDLANRAASAANFDDVPNCSDSTPQTAVIEISYPGQSEESMAPIVVDILHDDSGYFTDYSNLLKIPVPDNGSVDVTLKSFKVYDGATTGDVNDPYYDAEYGNLIWVAPAGDGDFSGYVDNPLPYTFQVQDGTKPYISVDVLCFDRRMANEYGYVFFDINQKEIFNFCMFGNYCTPAGRHYVASYSVDIWKYNSETEQKGVQLYDDLTATVSNNGGVYQADPLCVALPDDPNAEDDFYIEITIKDTDEYDANNVIVKQGVLTEMEAKMLFDANDDSKLDYYHFMVGCDDEDTPPVLDTPGDETTTYYACLRELNDSGVGAIAYVSLTGNQITTMIAAVNLDNGLHLQHIHGKADDSFISECPDISVDAPANGGNGDGLIQIGEGALSYGGPQLFLTQSGEGNAPDNTDFPSGTMYTYMRTVTLGTTGFPSLADMTPLDRKTVVIHGMTVNNSYVVSLPVACGQLGPN